MCTQTELISVRNQFSPELDMNSIHSRIGLDCNGSGFSGNFMDCIGWDDCGPFFKLVLIAAQLMPFLTNYDLWTFDYTGFIAIKSQH